MTDQLFDSSDEDDDDPDEFEIEDDEDEEDDEGYQLPPIDPVTHKLRVMAEKCSTCIFRPGNLMSLNSGRVAGMLQNVVRQDSYITCHQTLGTGEPGAICKGGSDAHMGQLERIARRLDGVIEVQPTEKAVT